jgi:LPXTG-site transpeptidase (sortase) family protein
VPPAAARPRLETSAFPSEVRVPGRPSAPVQLTIGAIGVDTKLVALGLDPAGALQVPDDFGRAGWFTEGPLPGEQGPAVIAGHVDSHNGPAVFYRLRELKAGDTVQVRRADGIRLRFEVDSVHQFPKAAFPRDAVFGTATAQALRLITCGGSFDHQRRSYRDNLVVDAHLVGFSRP